MYILSQTNQELLLIALAQETHGAYSMWFNPDVLSKTNITTPANLANPANY